MVGADGVSVLSGVRREIRRADRFAPRAGRPAGRAGFSLFVAPGLVWTGRPAWPAARAAVVAVEPHPAVAGLPLLLAVIHDRINHAVRLGVVSVRLLSRPRGAPGRMAGGGHGARRRCRTGKGHHADRVPGARRDLYLRATLEGVPPRRHQHLARRSKNHRPRSRCHRPGGDHRRGLGPFQRLGQGLESADPGAHVRQHGPV